MGDVEKSTELICDHLEPSSDALEIEQAGLLTSQGRHKRPFMVD